MEQAFYHIHIFIFKFLDSRKSPKNRIPRGLRRKCPKKDISNYETQTMAYLGNQMVTKRRFFYAVKKSKTPENVVFSGVIGVL